MSIEISRLQRFFEAMSAKEALNTYDVDVLMIILSVCHVNRHVNLGYKV